ncbi:MAG TPA: efflux RND transporter permease subunit [Rhizomicrobium sp.]|jgi:multidrug efflux pump subunit AcrB|nr:efflux RND transporter permease subunit [Rhizomicrobium sp.]
MRALTASSIKNPAAVAVGVAVVILFGIFALNALPVQLFPDIDRPQIGIETDWRAETPREVESQIVQPEEDVLQGIPGLQQLEGFAGNGGGYIQLTFALGTDMQSTLVDVVGRLNRLPPLPADAQKPFIQLASTQNANATLLYVFMQKLPGNNRDVNGYEHFLKDVVLPRLEAIPGVGSAQINGNGGTEELDIVFDPMRAAQLGIQIPKMAQQISGADDVSGGNIDVGRRQYNLEFRGRYSVADLKKLVLDWRNGKPVYLGDIADVHVGRSKAQGFAYQNGNPALGISVFRASGANVLATVNAVKEELQKINDGPAKEQGVVLQYSFDPSHFINQAMGMVTSDLIVGILLAVGVLWFFMREWRGTLIISAAIPICLFAVVMLLNLAGRTLNVISLAGLAFATGMVLDAAIVAFENILRLRERGMPAAEAAQTGTHQVWGALLASTATNVAIFVPVIFLKDVEGQLFADLSLTIAFAVLMSLIVAITVVPVASVLFLKTRPKIAGLTNVWRRISDVVMNVTNTPFKRRAWIVGLITSSVVGTWLLLPPVHYLPQVKRAAIDGFIGFSSGTSVDFADKYYAKPIIERLQPYLTGKKQPKLLNYYVKMNGPGNMDMAVRVPNDSDFPQLEKIVRNDVIKDLPDAQAFAQMGSLFGGFDQGGGVTINIQSNDEDAMRAAAKKGQDLLTARFPEGVVNSNPSLDYDQPQLKMKPDDRSIAEVGWTRPDVGNIVQSLGEGLYVGQRYDGERQLFLILKALPLTSSSQVADTPLATPSGNVVPFSHLVNMQSTLAASGTYRLNRRRTFALNFQPPRGVALQDVMTILRRDVEPQIRKLLPPDGTVTYGAAADHLDSALWNMGKNFGLAVLILFLIMAALFRSVWDSAIATIALPLGTVGGMAALRILGLFVFQPLDLITMIGFIIVLGLVVNNTILLVARTRQAEVEGMSRVDAVRSSLETRLRPIFSSTLTAVMGMLPLVFIPGPGAEIYRGLGAVIVGGILVSHVFTLVLMPAMLRLGEQPIALRQSPLTPANPHREAAE